MGFSTFVPVSNDCDQTPSIACSNQSVVRDDTARNLEGTQVLLAESQRELLDVVNRRQESESANAVLTQMLREAESTIRDKQSGAQESAQLAAALSQQLEEKQTAYATLERMLQDASSSLEYLRDQNAKTRSAPRHPRAILPTSRFGPN